MILILLIAAAAACVVAGVLSESLVLAYVALGLAVLGAAVFGFAALRERRSGAAGSARSEDLPESPEAVAGGESAEDAEGSETAALVDRVDDEKSPGGQEILAEGAPATEPRISTNGHVAVPGGDASVASKSGTAPVASAIAVEEPSRTVYVIPGRKRFHVVGCHILDGRSYEELTLADAEDEGFTACTSCSRTSPAE